jgi:hypothetical protein
MQLYVILTLHLSPQQFTITTWEVYACVWAKNSLFWFPYSLRSRINHNIGNSRTKNNSTVPQIQKIPNPSRPVEYDSHISIQHTCSPPATDFTFRKWFKGVCASVRAYVRVWMDIGNKLIVHCTQQMVQYGEQIYNAVVPFCHRRLINSAFCSSCWYSMNHTT